MSASASIERDVSAFLAGWPEMPKPTRIGRAEDEIVFEWIGMSGSAHAIVGFDGDGIFGYALLRDGAFQPGALPGLLDGTPPPADLVEYVRVLSTGAAL